MPPEPAISVLHVDDDPNQLQVSKLILERTDPNLHVQTTQNPHEALHTITHTHIDCIVTDYKMPDLNGIQLATKIRQHTDTPIILYTGQGSEKLAEEAFAIGVDDYIRKEPDPSHYQILAKRIRTAVDKHRAETHLQRSEENYRSVVEHANQGIIVIQDGLLRFVNHRLTEMAGYTHEELIDKPFIGYLHPEDRHEALEKYRSRDPSGTTIYPFRIIARNGDVLWIEVNGVSIDWNGSAATLHFITDITERKRARAEISQREEQYRALFATSPFSISIHDIDGVISSVNTAFTKLTGYTEQEVTGKTLSSLAIERKAERDKIDFIAEMHRALLSDSRLPSFEYSLKRKDGAERWCEVYASLLHMNGDRVGIQLLAHDITDQKRMREELKEANTALEGLVEEKTQELLDAERLVTAGRIAATVGHDLRGPLQTIKNAIYLMRQSPENVDEMIDMVNKSVDRASEMIDMFRSQTRYSPLILGDVNLVEMVRKAVEEATLPQSIEAVLELDEGLESVYLDGTKIHRVLDNLIQNAVEAMPTGGRLTVSAKRERGMVTLTVSDTGVGIPEDVIQSLFKPFHTTKEGGLGLGLYYCKRTVEAHEGTIELDSEVGAGTTFTIRIPVFTEDYLGHFEAQEIRSTLKGQ